MVHLFFMNGKLFRSWTIFKNEAIKMTAGERYQKQVYYEKHKKTVP